MSANPPDTRSVTTPSLVARAVLYQRSFRTVGRHTIAIEALAVPGRRTSRSTASHG
jgi:hypothetical protein